jgi:hypothetical protein
MFHNKGFNLNIKENSCHTRNEPNNAVESRELWENPMPLLGYKTLGEKLIMLLEYRAFKTNPKLSQGYEALGKTQQHARIWVKECQQDHTLGKPNG